VSGLYKHDVISQNIRVVYFNMADIYRVSEKPRTNLNYNFNYWGVHPVARVSSNVNKPPYATMFVGARFYCALTLHVSAPGRWPSSGDM
jgi:hypothetical protein